MRKQYKTTILVTFCVVILLIIITQFGGEDNIFHPWLEHVNFYVRNLRNIYTPLFHQNYDNYLQVFPGILLIGLKLGGVKGRFGWKRLLAFIALSVIITQVIVLCLKITTGVLRPDESNFFSFPSGHTTAAFMTATLLYKEYGFRSYWVGIVAYSAAIVTGMTRILNNRHWLFDVIVGAALGILLTELAYQLIKLIFKDKGLINHN